MEEFSTTSLPLQMEQLALPSKASDGMRHDVANLKEFMVKQANFESDIAHSLMNNLRPGQAMIHNVLSLLLDFLGILLKSFRT